MQPNPMVETSRFPSILFFMVDIINRRFTQINADLIRVYLRESAVNVFILLAPIAPVT